jgi:tRNA(Ile)-lysidine synthase
MSRPAGNDEASRLRGRIERGVDRLAAEAGLWPEDGRVLAAVSGGPDSTALLLILKALSERRRLKVTAAYFDHGLRGAAASAAERAAVQSLASRCGLELAIGAGDVAGLRQTAKLSWEEAARRARYDFLAMEAGKRGINCVAAGHTADDQAETVLMHLVRGAGLSGIAGMQPGSRWPFPGHQGLALIRPLLRLRRAETEAYCLANGVEPVQDSSNRSNAFLRNRVRQELLPKLAEYNPRIVEALGRLADAASNDLAALEALALPAVSRRGGAVGLDRGQLRAMPEALRRHAIRVALSKIFGDLQGLSARHLGAIEALATENTGGRSLDLPRSLRAWVERDELLLSLEPEEAVVPLPGGEVRLPVPGAVTLGDLSVAAGKKAPPDAMATVEVDAEALGSELCVRGWRPGDRIQPAGMAGSKKLQDLFVDAHVPRRERRRIPLFESGRGIVWVGGLRLAEWAKPQPGQATLVLSYRTLR